MSNATDAAVKLAAEHDIDLADVVGTGADGRITKGDVEARLASLADAENAESTEGAAAVEETAVSDSAADDRAPAPADEAIAPAVAGATPDFFSRVQAAANLQALIALGSLATSEEERVAIRARAKELLEK